MDSGEQGGASAASFPGSTTTAFAALTTILLATGSALYVRAKCTTSPLPNSTGMGVESTSATQLEARGHGEERNIQCAYAILKLMYSNAALQTLPRTAIQETRKRPERKNVDGGEKTP